MILRVYHPHNIRLKCGILYVSYLKRIHVQYITYYTHIGATRRALEALPREVAYSRKYNIVKDTKSLSFFFLSVCAARFMITKYCCCAAVYKVNAFVSYMIH